MDTVLQTQETSPQGGSFLSNPSRWFTQHRLSRGFWIFFTAAFFFDAGFAVYYFLFNLYLIDFHFNEKAIGLITSAGTLGSVVGTLPAGLIARRYGIRPVMLACFLAAPLFSILRVLFLQTSAQIVLAFLAGLAICLWGICFLPAVARLTGEDNRAAAFSLIFSVSIGTSALGGLLCGYLPTWLRRAGFILEPFEVKRAILIAASLLAFVGIAFVLRLRIPELHGSEGSSMQSWRTLFSNRFLRGFLPLMVLWSAILAAFTPFASVWLSRGLQLPLARIGVVFSVSQIVQLCVGLLTAPLFRVFGLRRGIASTQVAAALLLMTMASVQQPQFAAVLYLGFSAAQWMSSPGLYNLLMSGTPDRERSTAASFAMFLNALVGSGATAAAGAGFTHFGYPRMFLILGIIALAAGVCMALSHNETGEMTP